MKKLMTLALLCLATASFLSAQIPAIELKLQLLSDMESWGVYAKAKNTISPSSATITGSAQVTIVMPTGFDWSNLVSNSGTWSMDAVVSGPTENPNMAYYSFGLVTDNPAIHYQPDVETLLFFFKSAGTCPDSIYLIDNTTDPFNDLPNSVNSNPGNQFSIIDFGVSGVPIYSYSNNYALSAWNCKDSDGDGYLNAYEDTNGNGAYNSGDMSNLFDPLSPNNYAHLNLKLQLLEDGERWGVFVKPDSTISFSTFTITSIATINLLMPLDFTWSDLHNHGGTWTNFATGLYKIDGETWRMNTFGLVTDYPSIQYTQNGETLLFSFKTMSECPDTLFILKNVHRPVCPNDCPYPYNYIEMIDLGTPGAPSYNYAHNYAPSAWSCHDNDGDGILNAHEDTNGNGVYDQGLDASNLNGGPYKALDFKLQLMPDGKTWGVYVKPDSFISPSTNTITGSAQVTVVMPFGYQWNSLVNHAGTWTQNATAAGPAENPGRTYTSFGLLTYLPQINYVSGQETLLFTFKGISACPDTMYLIDNENDPFTDLPNSFNSNPGNEISVLDTGTIDWKVYYYGSNYAPSAWSCHDNDGDGILNAHEDTNGNGVYDPGVDASDLNLNNCITITQQPEDVNGCTGSSAIFTTVISNPTGVQASYQWEVSTNSGVTWFKLFNNSIYDGVVTPVLSINSITNLNGNFYRLRISTPDCDPIYTVPALIQLNDPLTLIDEPDNATSCSGNGITMQATIINAGTGTISYQWEQSCDLGLTWADISEGGVNGYEGVNSNKLIINDVVGLNSCQFRLRYSSGGCVEKWSNFGLLTVQGPLSIATQPVDSDTICSGNPVCFSVQVVNENSGLITYQWQIKYANATTWINLQNNATFSGTKTANMCLATVAGLDKAQFRALVKTSNCSAITSDVALLRVSFLTVMKNPYDVVICSGEAVSFTSLATYSVSSQNPGSDIEYQWQVSTDNGLFWSDINSTTDGGVYSNFNTSTLNVSDVTGLYGRSYRLRFEANGCSEIYSVKAKLKISGPISIINPPEDYSTCGSGYLFLSTGVLNESLDFPNDGIFKWQESKDNGLTWHYLDDNIIYGGTETDTLLITEVSGKNNYRYRLLYWTSVCDTITSNAATLTVEGPLEVTAHPQNTTLCPDESAVFSASVTNAGAGNVIFKWQTTSNGITWTDISEGSPTGFGGTYSGTNTEKLEISKVKGLNGRKYRLKARTGECDFIFSTGAILQVDGSICPTKKCIQLKLEYQPAKANWAVKLRAQPGSPATTGNVLTSASITLVAPQDFDYQNFTSKKGVWELSGTLENPAENPGMKYLTFELQPGAASLNLSPWTETTLFTFKKMGDCPDSLYLMNGMIPQGIEPNEIKGHGQSSGQTHSLQLCGVYDPAAWSCLSPAPPDDLPIDTDVQLQFAGGIQTAQSQALEKQKTTTTGEPIRFSVSPNPATSWLDISFENNRPKANATLRLLSLQGQPLHLQSLPDTGHLRLDLTALPPGIYFLTLEVDGKVVQREKVVKF